MDTALNIDVPGVVLNDDRNKDEILKKVRSLCGWYQNSFPGSQPVSLNKKKLESCIGRNLYVACEKTDGIRLLLYAASRRVFLIDRNQKVNMLVMTLPSSYWDTVFDVKFKRVTNSEKNKLPKEKNDEINDLLNLDINNENHKPFFQQNTLLDGELVKDLVEYKNEKKYVLRYLIYDCISIERDSTIKTLPLLERLKYVYSKVISPKTKYDMNRKTLSYADTPPFEIFLKDFYDVNEVPAILNFSKRLPHPSDGIIFTPVNLPYVPGTCTKLLKWKPPHLNTADFAVEFHSERESSESKIYLELLVAIRGVRASVDCFCVPVGEMFNKLVEQYKKHRISGQIIECFYDENAVYSKPRRSKNGEILWDQPPITMQGGWIAERVRTDKESPNDIRTVNKVFESIRDGINSDLLIKTVKLYKKSGKKSVLNYCNVPDYVKDSRKYNGEKKQKRT